MAELSLVMGYAHTPYLFGRPSIWPGVRERIRRGKPVRDDLPRETDSELGEKYARSMNAFTALRRWIEAARLDALIVIGDDQKEIFPDYTVPFTVYTGETVAGKRLPGRVREVTGDQAMIQVPNHVGLAREIVSRLVQGGFDVGYFSEIEDKVDGFGHAFAPPLNYLTPDLDVPVVPIMVNCYYPPQPPAQRCYQFGQALRAAMPEIRCARRVAVACSGGLWHTPGSEDATIDEGFDRELLGYLEKGQGPLLGELEDRLLVSGTGEIRNWIVGAGMTDRSKWQIVDYVPLYFSPIGMGFAACHLLDAR